MLSSKHNRQSQRKTPIILIIILFVNLGIISILTIVLRDYKQRLVSMETWNDAVKASTSQFGTFWLTEQINNGNQVIFNEKPFDKDNISSSLEEIVSDGGKIVLRYFSNICLTCYEKPISVFSKYCNGDNRNKFIVLSDIYNPIRIQYFISDSKIECPIFGSQALNLNIPCEELEMPYCFILDSDLNVRMSFMIRQSNSELFEEYLKLAIRKIDDNV